MPDGVLPPEAVEEIRSLLEVGVTSSRSPWKSLTEQLESGAITLRSAEGKAARQRAFEDWKAIQHATVTAASGVYEVAERYGCGLNTGDPEQDQQIQETLRLLLGTARKTGELFTPSRKGARDLDIPDVFKDGAAPSLVNHAAFALFRAIQSGLDGKGWDDNNGETVPMHVTKTNRGRGMAVVSMRPDSGAANDPGALLPSLWDRVRTLDDLSSDTLLVCLAQWASRADGPNTPVWISADAILDARGVKRIQKSNEPGNWQHGHRREDRVAAGRALAQLVGLWIQLINVEVTRGGKRRNPRKVQVESSPALAILGITEEVDSDGHRIFLRASVMPGEWARAYWDLGLRQTGLFAQKALAYDPYRQQLEKRIAKYLAFQFRWNASKESAPCRLRVSTLLDNAGTEVETANPQRTRNRLERALERLKLDGVIADWSYVINVDDRLPARGWVPAWLNMTITVEPPAMIREQYASIRGA